VTATRPIPSASLGQRWNRQREGSEVNSAKFVSIVLAVIGACAGIVAAVYWYKASTIKIRARAGGAIFGGGMATPTAPFLAGALDAIAKSSRLNMFAAIWTAASVLFSAASAIAGAFSN